MTDRLHCINPACRRSAPKPNFPYATEIVCQKCWKSVPQHLKFYYRHWRHNRRYYEKYALRWGDSSVSALKWEELAREQAKNWSRIRDFFQIKPEFPAALEGFFREMGWQDNGPWTGARNEIPGGKNE